MQFSVIVPFYNAKPYSGRCVEALLHQTISPDEYEILMVDNNSSDGSHEIPSGNARVRMLAAPEQGSYAARNVGLRNACGAIAVFTDPDCVPQAGWLEQIGRAMRDERIAIVLGGRRFATDTGTLGMLGAYESALVAHTFARGDAGTYFAYTNNMAIRMAVLMAAGGFRHVPRGGDTLLLREVIRRCGPGSVRHVPEAYVRHLEIASLADYFEKKRVYGRVNADPELGANALSLPVRLRLAARAMHSGQGSSAERIAFCMALARGAIQFEWERRRAKTRAGDPPQ